MHDSRVVPVRLRSRLTGIAAATLVWLTPLSAPAADSVATITDSTAKPSRRPVAEILAEADSAVKARGGAKADKAQLFLSWNAPWGQARARRERLPACRDSTSEDTLFLCMTPGRTSDQFLAFTSQLTIHAVGADTLGPWWHMQGKGGRNPGAMRVDWAPTDEAVGTPPLFASDGHGFIVLEPARTTARIRLIYGTPMIQKPQPFQPDAVYTLARIILKHNPGRGLSGCESPVVIEWDRAKLTFAIKDEPAVARGERFATYGGSYALSEPFRRSAVKAWSPPGPAAK